MSQVLHSVCSAFFKTLQTINAYALPNLCQEVTSCAAYIGLCNIKPETIRKDQKYNFKIKKNCRRTICNWNEKIKSSNLSRFNDGYIMVRQTTSLRSRLLKLSAKLVKLQGHLLDYKHCVDTTIHGMFFLNSVFVKQRTADFVWIWQILVRNSVCGLC